MPVQRIRPNQRKLRCYGQRAMELLEEDRARSNPNREIFVGRRRMRPSMRRERTRVAYPLIAPVVLDGLESAHRSPLIGCLLRGKSPVCGDAFLHRSDFRVLYSMGTESPK